MIYIYIYIYINICQFKRTVTQLLFIRGCHTETAVCSACNLNLPLLNLKNKGLFLPVSRWKRWTAL